MRILVAKIALAVLVIGVWSGEGVSAKNTVPIQVTESLQSALRASDRSRVLDVITKNDLVAHTTMSKKIGQGYDLENNLVHILASETYEDTEVLETVVQDSAALNVFNDDGHTPLHIAASLGKKQTVEFFLAKGARADAHVVPDGKTPIALAEENGHAEIAETLRLYTEAAELAGETDAGEEDVEEAGIPDFLVDLNARAEAGEIDPVVGRVAEMKEVLEILSRRRKNNPMLIGSAGVGKTAIVEGIADLIVKGEAPAPFLDKNIYIIDVGALIAGTGARGAFEERVQELLQFAEENTDALFFIDEAHLIVGSGAQGGIDAANLLKPALARGTLRCIGATTDDEYRRHILTDKALARRFSVVSVGEPSIPEAIEITLQNRDLAAGHHDIEITDAAVAAAVKYSHLYITDRFLPDKSIDLLDEAGANQRLLSEMAQLDRQDLQTRVGLLETFTELDAELSERLEKLKSALAQYETDGEEGKRIVGREHVAALISRKIGVPVEKILQEKQEKVLELLPLLETQIFGQSESLRAIVGTLLNAYAELSEPQRPLASVLLSGPTGTGKTETAKALARVLFDDEHALIHLNMSEYMERHAVAKLFGSPPGYVGYDDGGILTSAVMRRPYSVVLFDEVEKAHPEFMNVLLQILDEGQLTDNRGNVVDFKNTIVVMTTNVGDVDEAFRPEVLGRMDNRLEYNALDVNVMAQLVERQLALLNERLRDKKISLTLTEDAIKMLSKEGYDPKYGARPLRKKFYDRINLPLARMILEGGIREGSYSLNLNDTGLEIKSAE